MPVSLPIRLFRLVFGGYVVLAIVVTGIQLAVEYASVLDGIDDDLTSLNGAFSRSVAEALWTYDQPLLDSMARGIAQSSVVTGVRIESADGTALVTSGEVFPISGDLETPPFAPFRHRSVPLVVHSLRGEDVQVGRLTLFSNRNVALSRVGYSFVVIFVNSLVKTAGLWVIFHVVMSRVLVRPLMKAGETISNLDLAVAGPEDIAEVDYIHRGELGFLFEALRDLRERLAAARSELQDLHQTLERKVQDRTQELERANSELQQFAYAASHDMREPLRMISSYLGLLERREGATLSAEGHEFLGFAKDGAQRMDRLILGLLDYSRLGRSAQPKKPVPLGDALAEAVANLSLVIEAAKARVESPAPLPEVIGNREELVRVFQNLIANAVKYGASDRIPMVTISAQRDGDFWRISVADNGIGIPADQTERIFAIFQRLHAVDVEGCGIGLASCKKVVEHHGGRIWVESEPGKGSIFFFTLPVAR